MRLELPGGLLVVVLVVVVGGKVVINVPPTRLPPSRLSTTIWTQQWHFHHSNVEQHSLEGSTNKSIWMCYARQCHCQSHEWEGQQGHIRFWSTHHSLLIESHPPLFVWKSSHYWIIKESSHHNTKSQSQYLQNNSCAAIKGILLTLMPSSHFLFPGLDWNIYRGGGGNFWEFSPQTGARLPISHRNHSECRFCQLNVERGRRAELSS